MAELDAIAPDNVSIRISNYQGSQIGECEGFPWESLCTGLLRSDLVPEFGGRKHGSAVAQRYVMRRNQP
jgi:hypothetical protein